jgi:TolB-like protein/DNA-binding winged helix-turn-helix (wHTH) protein
MITTEAFKVGDWLVEPDRDRISCGSERRSLRPKVMDLLVYLAQKHGQVVSGDELLDHLWPDTVVTGGSVYRCVGELREALASNGENRVFIETIPKKGYRLRVPVAEVEGEDDRIKKRPVRRLALIALGIAFAGLAVWMWNRLDVETPTTEAYRPSLAVLAFDDMNDDSGNDYFADGLSEDLLNLLARIPELRVISRSSSFSFKGRNVAIPQVAEQLNVDLIIEGSVRREGSRVRITAQLIEVLSDTHLWSESYDREVDDVFYIQHQVSNAIVAALKNELGLRIESAPEPLAQTTPEARDAYLRGRHLIGQRSAVTIENAAREFQTAVSLDPEFAPAHAELAIATLLLSRGNYGDLPESDAIGLAEPIAARALELDPEIPEAHLSRSLIEMMKGRYEEALPHLQRAIELSPSNGLAYSWLGSAYDRLGRYKEYFETTKIALSLDPLSQPTLVNHIQNLIDRNELAEAERELDKLASVSPRAAASMRGMLASLDGKWAEGALARLDALKIDPGSMQVRLILSWQFAYLGLDDEVLSVSHYTYPEPLSLLGKPVAALEKGEELYALDPDSLFTRRDLALALAGAGEHTRARPLLEEIWEQSGAQVNRSGLATRSGLPVRVAMALIAARLHDGAEIDDLLLAMEDNVRRTREAGLTRTVQRLSVDFEEGYVAYVSGDHESGLQLIAKAAEDGYIIAPADASYDLFRDEPVFVEILERQARRQARERTRFLTVVCNNNPYAGVWEPATNTCQKHGY